MKTRDGRDVSVENLTPENYLVPAGEERYYHAIIEVRQFDPKTGQRLSRPRLQKFGRKIFETHVLDSLRKQGYEITILHNPKEWYAEQAAKAAEMKRRADAEKAQAEAEAKAALRAELKAEILAEIKAAQDAELASAEKPAESTETDAAGEVSGEGEKTAQKAGETSKTAKK